MMAVSDALDEDDETVIIDIQSVTNGTESGTQQKTITITDDDASPTVTLNSTAVSIAEAAGSTSVTAILSAVSGRAVTVTLAKSGTATDVTDYTLSSTTITIAAGSTTGSATVTAVNDALDELDETVIIDIQSVTNGTESGTQQKTITITDDDAAPTVTLTTGATSITEATYSIFVTATLSAISGQAVTVTLAKSGTATDVTDYTLSSTTITIAAGSTTGSATVTSVSDVLDENDETVILDIQTVTNGTENGTQQKTITITDDDDAPLMTLSTPTTSFSEVGGSAVVTTTLNAISGKTITLNYTFSGTATQDTDYQVLRRVAGKLQRFGC
jgi:hypothetical protein